MRFKSLIILLGFLMISLASASLDVQLSDQGTGVAYLNGTTLSSGDLTVLIYDVSSGGSPIYNETFNNNISEGSWNIMLGSGVNLPLEFGRVYYKDYLIAGEDASFDGADRQAFYSPLGDINSSDLTGDIEINTTGNITASYYHGDGSQLSNLPSGDNSSWNESYARDLFLENGTNIELGVNNITTTGYGFFGWLGSIGNFITGLFVQDVNVTGNITLNGTSIDDWSDIAGADTQKNASGYLYNDSTTVYLNETLLNETIESLTNETDPIWNSSFSNMQIDCPSGEYAYGFEVNGSLRCREDILVNGTNVSTARILFKTPSDGTTVRNLQCGDIPCDPVGATARSVFTIDVPDNAVSIDNIYALIIPDASETIQFDCYAEWMDVGESRPASTDSLIDASQAVVEDDLFRLDITDCMNGVSAGNLLGINFESDIATIYLVGVEMHYTAEAVDVGSGSAWNITTSNYLVNSSGVLEINETELNESIDAKIVGLGDNASWNESYAGDLFLENGTNIELGANNITTTGYGFFGWLGSIGNRITGMFVANIDVSGNITLNGTGIDDWSDITEGVDTQKNAGGYLYNDSTTIYLNETLLNETITSEGVAVGFNSTYNSTYNAKADYQFTTNSFNGSGNIATLGNITASYFIGNGSLLTGIPVRLWTNVSGTATYGDDVNVTGNMNVEQNLTFSTNEAKIYLKGGELFIEY